MGFLDFILYNVAIMDKYMKKDNPVPDIGYKKQIGGLL